MTINENLLSFRLAADDWCNYLKKVKSPFAARLECVHHQFIIYNYSYTSLVSIENGLKGKINTLC